jgi:hypothetical protein
VGRKRQTTIVTSQRKQKLRACRVTVVFSPLLYATHIPLSFPTTDMFVSQVLATPARHPPTTQLKKHQSTFPARTCDTADNPMRYSASGETCYQDSMFWVEPGWGWDRGRNVGLVRKQHETFRCFHQPSLRLVYGSAYCKFQIQFARCSSAFLFSHPPLRHFKFKRKGLRAKFVGSKSIEKVQNPTSRARVFNQEWCANPS